MLFWVVIALLTLAVVGLLALALLRAQGQSTPPAAYDLRVYRDQLREVDRDLARKVVSPEDAERARAEISRRILAADAQVQAQLDAPSGPKALTWATIGALTILLMGGGYGLYRSYGAPGYMDLPRQARIDEAERARLVRLDQAAAEELANIPSNESNADPRLLELMVQLRARAGASPDELQGQRLLAQYEHALGNFAAARTAQANVIEILGPDVTARDYATLAEIMIQATDGYVSPEAEIALVRALAIDPANGPARFFQGLFLAQIGRPDQAFTVWDRLLRSSPPDAPWAETIAAQIGDLAILAGVDYTPPPPPVPSAPLPGPDADDIAAAQDMSPEDRQAMIRGMVEGLSERLASEGGTPQEWVRLISVLTVLQETERARTALQDARAAYPNDTAALAMFDDAATQAGLSE